MRTSIFALALTVALSACGGPTDPAALNDAGAQALGSGNYAEAATNFDASLTAINGDTSNPQYQRAMWGMIEAAAHADPKRAESDFLQYAKSNSAVVSAKDYIKVANWLTEAKAFVEATHVGDAGMKAYSESPELDAMMKQIAKKAAQAGDKAATSALSGLGYLGGDE